MHSANSMSKKVKLFCCTWLEFPDAWCLRCSSAMVYVKLGPSAGDVCCTNWWEDPMKVEVWHILIVHSSNNQAYLKGTGERHCSKCARYSIVIYVYIQMKISTYRVFFKDIYAYRTCWLHALGEWLFFYFKYIICNVTCNAKELMRSVERQIRIQLYDVYY